MSPRDRHSQDLWVATWTGTLQLGGQQETKQFMTKCAAGYKVEPSRSAVCYSNTEKAKRNRLPWPHVSICGSDLLSSRFRHPCPVHQAGPSSTRPHTPSSVWVSISAASRICLFLLFGSRVSICVYIRAILLYRQTDNDTKTVSSFLALVSTSTSTSPVPSKPP